MCRGVSIKESQWTVVFVRQVVTLYSERRKVVSAVQPQRIRVNRRNLDGKNTSISAPITTRTHEWINSSHLGKPRKQWVHSGYSRISIHSHIYTLCSPLHTLPWSEMPSTGNIPGQLNNHPNNHPNPPVTKSATNTTLLCAHGATPNYPHPRARATTISTFSSSNAYYLYTSPHNYPTDIFISVRS